MKKAVIAAFCLLLCAAVFTTTYNIKENNFNNKNEITAVKGIKSKSVKSTQTLKPKTTLTTVTTTSPPTTSTSTTAKTATTATKAAATQVKAAQNTAAATTAFTYSLSDYEQQVVTLVNAERAKANLPALTVNLKLSYCARCKAQDMHDNNYFSHTSPKYGTYDNMIRAFGISFNAAGENIAMGQASPQDVMNAWMNSEGHRNNILSSKYTQIGVGYVASGNYWVQQFIC